MFENIKNSVELSLKEKLNSQSVKCEKAFIKKYVAVNSKFNQYLNNAKSKNKYVKKRLSKERRK